jgi:WD40 repeat protein/serine/threonine protein kinase
MNEESLFAAALNKPTGAERRAFLDQACAGDAALRQRVEQLLAADQQSAGILEHGPDDVAQQTRPSEPSLAADRLFADRFKLRQKLGEGGMGEVWVADQTEPVQRRVALKVVRPGLDSARMLARFEQERQALALMDHPNIAKVLDAGVTEGRPYFVMELIKGVSITQYCDEAKLSPRARLEMFVPVCQAVQHAHQKGIIHRDLKPSNILVALYDGRPVPKVIDFGVAKATGPRLTEHSVYTEVGSLIGTLEYMSPEQAELNNLDIDTRSDIYALGAILYELLTGSVPFSRKELQAAAFTEMLRIIKEVEPPRPSTRLSGSGTLPSVAARRHTEPHKLIALIRGELDWIVIKCLEKDRGRRYQSANGLAQDLERYLANEPVEACPPSAGYPLRKLAGKYRTPLRVASAFLLLLVLGVIVSMWLAIRATLAEQAARESEKEARHQKQEASDARDQAEKRGDQLASLNDQLRRTNYVADMNLARVAWDENNLLRTGELLDKYQARPGETDLRGFEWYYLRRLLHADLRTLKAHEGGVTAMAFMPDGKLLTSGTDRPPEGMRDSKEATGQVKLWDPRTGKPLDFQLGGLPRKLERVAVSRDGSHLAAVCGDRAIRVWNLNSGQQFTLEGPLNHLAIGARFSPDGKRLVSMHFPTDNDYSKNTFAIWIWNLSARKAEVTLDRIPFVLGADFSPDGKQLVMCLSYQSIVKVVNATTGEEAYQCKYGDGYVMRAVFSPDGKRLFGCGERGLRVWDTATRETLAVWPAATSVGVSLAFSPDGKHLALGGVEGAVDLRDSATGRLEHVFKGHSGQVSAMAFNRDSSRLATGGADGTVRVWDATGKGEALSIAQFSSGVDIPVISPDGQTLLTGLKVSRSGRTFRFWDSATAKPRGAAIEMQQSVRSCDWSGDSNHLYLTDEGKAVTIVDVATSKVRHSYTVDLEIASDGQIVTALSPNEKWYAHSAPKRAIQVRDAQNGIEFRTIKDFNDLVHNLEFTSDGSRLASAEESGVVKIWNVATGSATATTKLDGVYVQRMRFSPDGKQLAVVGNLSHFLSGEVRILDSDSGHQVWSLKGHTLNVTDCVFSPDGQRLATASADKTIRLWDLITGQEILKLSAYTDFVIGIRLVSDGQRLIGASMQRTIRVWDATPLPD